MNPKNHTKGEVLNFNQEAFECNEDEFFLVCEINKSIIGEKVSFKELESQLAKYEFNYCSQSLLEKIFYENEVNEISNMRIISSTLNKVDPFNLGFNLVKKLEKCFDIFSFSANKVFEFKFRGFNYSTYAYAFVQTSAQLVDASIDKEETYYIFKISGNEKISKLYHKEFVAELKNLYRIDVPIDEGHLFNIPSLIINKQKENNIAFEMAILAMHSYAYRIIRNVDLSITEIEINKDVNYENEMINENIIISECFLNIERYFINNNSLLERNLLIFDRYLKNIVFEIDENYISLKDTFEKLVIYFDKVSQRESIRQAKKVNELQTIFGLMGIIISFGVGIGEIYGGFDGKEIGGVVEFINKIVSQKVILSLIGMILGLSFVTVPLVKALSLRRKKRSKRKNSNKLSIKNSHLQTPNDIKKVA